MVKADTLSESTLHLQHLDCLQPSFRYFKILFKYKINPQNLTVSIRINAYCSNIPLPFKMGYVRVIETLKSTHPNSF